MATVRYFENIHTGRRYKVIGINQEKNTVKLQGEIGTFEETYDKKKFKENGYKLITLEEEDGE